MNPLNSLENHLHSWPPRPPSSEVRARWSGGGSVAPRRPPAFLPFARWLPPALACVALTLAVLQTPSWMSLSAGRDPNGLLAGFSLSNQVSGSEPVNATDRNLRGGVSEVKEAD
jgi:hypothetical protein